jgi:hypothetical protein
VAPEILSFRRKGRPRFATAHVPKIAALSYPKAASPASRKGTGSRSPFIAALIMRLAIISRSRAPSQESPVKNADDPILVRPAPYDLAASPTAAVYAAAHC